MTRHWLARDIAIVVTLKVVVIMAASFFVFGSKQRPEIDESVVAERLLAPVPEAQTGRGL